MEYNVSTFDERKDGFENKLCMITDIRLMENRKNHSVAKATPFTNSGGFYDQLQDVDFFVDGGSGFT